jgi:oligogalacturonide lyase
MKLLSTVALLIATVLSLHAQEVLETGGRTMPNEWIDKDTKHRIVKLTRLEGRSNLSFYFHR